MSLITDKINYFLRLLFPETTSQDQTAPILSRDIWTVFLFSGVAGFFLGSIVYPTWQHSVEGAQVVSGIVSYPDPSPFYQYEINLWTLSHQITALFLSLGLSEHVLSMVISGILGMISLQALALATLAISGNKIFAMLLPFWIQLTHSISFGVVYIIQLFGTFTTYGVLGLGYIVLTVCMISLGRNKTGYFLLGMAPAVHPSLGSYVSIVAFLVLFLDRFTKKKMFDICWPFLAAGWGVCLLSFIARCYAAHRVPNFFYHETSPYVANFVRYWCGHRGPVDIGAPGFRIQIEALLVGVFALVLFKKELSANSHFLVNSIIISGIISVPLAFVSWIPSQYLPTWLLAPIPARYLNFNIFLMPSLLLGLMFREKNNFRMQSLLFFTLLMMGKLARSFQLYPEWMAAELFLSAVLWLALKIIFKVPQSVKPRWAERMRFLNTVLLFAVFLKFLSLTPSLGEAYRTEFFNEQEKPFWDAVSKDKGMILTSHDVNLVQLRSRRPVLLDVASIDGLPYAPESGPLMEEILTDIYESSLLKIPNPPDEPLIAEDVLKTVWENRTADEWKSLAKKYSFTQILTYGDWNLKLTQKTQNGSLVLYDI